MIGKNVFFNDIKYKIEKLIGKSPLHIIRLICIYTIIHNDTKWLNHIEELMIKEYGSEIYFIFENLKDTIFKHAYKKTLIEYIEMLKNNKIPNLPYNSVIQYDSIEKMTIVCVIGGITFDEIAALQDTIATNIINNHTFVKEVKKYDLVPHAV